MDDERARLINQGYPAYSKPPSQQHNNQQNNNQHNNQHNNNNNHNKITAETLRTTYDRTHSNNNFFSFFNYKIQSNNNTDNNKLAHSDNNFLSFFYEEPQNINQLQHEHNQLIKNQQSNNQQINNNDGNQKEGENHVAQDIQKSRLHQVYRMYDNERIDALCSAGSKMYVSHLLLSLPSPSYSFLPSFLPSSPSFLF